MSCCLAASYRPVDQGDPIPAPLDVFDDRVEANYRAPIGDGPQEKPDHRCIPVQNPKGTVAVNFISRLRVSSQGIGANQFLTRSIETFDVELRPALDTRRLTRPAQEFLEAFVSPLMRLG